MFGTVRVYDLVWEDGRPARVMDVDGTMQSATYTDDGWCDPVFEYYVLYDLMYECPIRIRNVLMLGGAGYGYPKYLISTDAGVALTVVEKDPVVTDLARRYFYLDRLMRTYHTEESGRLRLVCDDALAYLRNRDIGAARGRYDAILNDCFCGASMPEELTSVRTAKLIKDQLTPGGAYLSNVVSALEGYGNGPLVEAADALAPVFTHVYAVSTGRNPSDLPDNIMVIASDASLDLPFARQLQ